MFYGVSFVKFLVKIYKISEIKSFTYTYYIHFFQEYLVYRKQQGVCSIFQP